ncbi:MAG TPA: efflux RND transporter periplasmic adaptor subunit [Thermoanaerobaculia bacterium]
MINRSRTRLAAISLSAVTLAACGRSHAPAPAPTPDAVRARLATAERLTLPNEVALAGSVEAERSAAVASRVMALVTEVHARLGERVAAGELLVTIDPTAAEGQLGQARGALAQAEAALALAEKNHQRFQALAVKQAASELEVDLARAQHHQAQGAVEQARGAVAAARSVAHESRVVAPFAGRVAARMVEAGDLAAPGRPLMAIESEGGRRLAVDVPERLASALAVGATLPVALDGRPDLGRFAAEIVETAPGPDPTTHTVRVKLALVGVDVAAGAAGRAWATSGERAAVAVPAAAIVRSGGLALVVVRDAEGRAASRVVTLGRTLDDGRVEVLSGLAGDETVALGLAAAPPAGAPLAEAGS